MAKNKPRGRPKGRKATAVIQARVDETMAEALDALASRTRRTKNVEMVLALEKHLAEAGLWPFPPEEKE